MTRDADVPGDSFPTKYYYVAEKNLELPRKSVNIFYLNHKLTISSIGSCPELFESLAVADASSFDALIV